ncbi:MAG: DNA polymerase III subunit beta [Ignavibacterium sp.]|jgi:DNA polymerase-3 subunit beta
MKFTVASSEIQKVLSKIIGVVPAKSTLPILENILFELKKNTLRLMATDLEVSMAATVEVKGSEDGSITIPAKRLMETIRALSDVNIVFTADLASNKVKMITENGEYTLLGESGEEFPTVPQFKGEDRIVLDGSMLRRVISRTNFSVSTDELRPAMTGVLFQAQPQGIRAVATDGHRLVRFSVKGVKQAQLRRDIIIPAKALNLAVRTAEEAESTILVDTTHVQFLFGTTTLTSRLIEEHYPNYESVIPLDNTKIVTVNRETLLASVRRVALYSSTTTHQIRFSIKGNEMRIAAEDLDFGGEAREKVACKYSGDEIEIGFNSLYVIDMLSHMDADEISFKLSTPVRAAIMTPATQKENEDLLMLVMPVRLNV